MLDWTIFHCWLSCILTNILESLKCLVSKLFLTCIHGILYYRPTHGTTESQNWRPIEKCMIFRNFRRKFSQPLLRILRITFYFTPEDNRMCWKLNKWKYVFLLWTPIIIKQHKGVIIVSDKRYNTHDIESEISISFTGITEPFIQSIPCEWIKSLV